VAAVALLRHLDVGRRHGQGVLARVGRIVAGRAATGRPGVVHARRCEGGEVSMAGIAGRSRRNMRARLGRPLVRRAIVAIGRAAVVADDHRR